MAGTAFADAGFGWAFTDGRGAMPMETDQITMEAESVSIVPDTLAPSPYSADMNVTCVFYLRNLTDQPLDVSVFFPFESLYDDNPRLRFLIGDMGFIRNEMTYDAAIEMMESEEGSSIPADSLVPEWLQFRAFTAEEEFDIYYRKGVVNKDMRLVFWPLMACWNMHFDPGERIRLMNTYNTGWDYEEYYEWISSFTYITLSGATWAGSIGDAVISLTVPEYYSANDTCYCYWFWGGSPTIEGNTLTWHYTDWEPEEDITFTAYGCLARINTIRYIFHSMREALIESWKPEELYPRTLEIFTESGDILSAETISAYLERWAYIMCGMIEPDSHRYFDRFFVSDEPVSNQLILDTIVELKQHLADCRNTMESAGIDFLLPMVILRKNWFDVNMEMYCRYPRQQIAYLILLENISDAVNGEPVIDPAVKSLFWLAGWFLPDEVSPMRNRFTEDYVNNYRDYTRSIVSRAEVREFWRDGGGCEIPLVRSTCVSDMFSPPQALSIEASSEYSGQHDDNYRCANLIDYNHETSWLEGSGGYGYGESVTVTIRDGMSVQGFWVVNGCLEFTDTRDEYSRVRKLFVCLNDKPLMVAQLFDVTAIQTVSFPLTLNLREKDRLSFEIVEVYPGSVYRNAGLSELFLKL